MFSTSALSKTTYHLLLLSVRVNDIRFTKIMIITFPVERLTGQLRHLNYEAGLKLMFTTKRELFTRFPPRVSRVQNFFRYSGYFLTVRQRLIVSLVLLQLFFLRPPRSYFRATLVSPPHLSCLFLPYIYIKAAFFLIRSPSYPLRGTENSQARHIVPPSSLSFSFARRLEPGRDSRRWAATTPHEARNFCTRGFSFHRI